MRKCEKFLVLSLIWVMISLTYGKPRRNIKEASETNPLFRPHVPTLTGNPQCAGNLTYCEDIDSYPYLHLKRILDSNNSFRNIFRKDELKEELMEELANRQNSDGIFICSSITRTVFPKAAKNKNNKWKFIINQDNYLQGIIAETCHHPDNACDIIGEIPAVYTTFCRQKYVYSKLLSLDDNGYPAPDTFKIPSACCCAYRRNTFY